MTQRFRPKNQMIALGLVGFFCAKIETYGKYSQPSRFACKQSSCDRNSFPVEIISAGTHSKCKLNSGLSGLEFHNFDPLTLSAIYCSNA